MNYPMNIYIDNETPIIINNYKRAAIVAKTAKATGLAHSGSLDIRCQKTGGYMGRVCLESFNVYNARDELVYPEEKEA